MLKNIDKFVPAIGLGVVALDAASMAGANNSAILALLAVFCGGCSIASALLEYNELQRRKRK